MSSRAALSPLFVLLAACGAPPGPAPAVGPAVAPAGGDESGWRDRYAQDMAAAESPADDDEADDESLCDSDGKRVRAFDLNGDGKADVWKLSTASAAGDVLRCKKVDLDHDGRADYMVGYAAGEKVRFESYDFDFDGVVDSFRQYDPATGKPTMTAQDTDADGVIDVIQRFEAGVLAQVLRDRNGDQDPDVWERYDGGAVVIEYDDDFDGEVDRTERR